MTTEKTPPDGRPRPAVVEWGADAANVTITLSKEQVTRFIALPLAGLASVIAFVATTQPWQTTAIPEVDEFLTSDRFELGLGAVTVWGTCWLLGTILLATATWYALFSADRSRQPARTAGLCLAGVLAVVLAAAAVELSRFHSAIPSIGFVGLDLSFGPGAGFVLACIGTLLFGAALWFSKYVTPGVHLWFRRSASGILGGPSGASGDARHDSLDDSPDDSTDSPDDSPDEGSGGPAGGVRDLTVRPG